MNIVLVVQLITLAKYGGFSREVAHWSVGSVEASPKTKVRATKAGEVTATESSTQAAQATQPTQRSKNSSESQKTAHIDRQFDEK